MASTRTRPAKVYRLYTKCDPGHEPKVATSVGVEDKDGHVIGDTVEMRPKWGYRRGALIYITDHYGDLVRHAQVLAQRLGMPKSRIWDIFDWNN